MPPHSPICSAFLAILTTAPIGGVAQGNALKNQSAREMDVTDEPQKLFFEVESLAAQGADCLGLEITRNRASSGSELFMEI